MMLLQAGEVSSQLTRPVIIGMYTGLSVSLPKLLLLIKQHEHCTGVQNSHNQIAIPHFSRMSSCYCISLYSLMQQSQHSTSLNIPPYSCCSRDSFKHTHTVHSPCYSCSSQTGIHNYHCVGRIPPSAGLLSDILLIPISTLLSLLI